MTNVLEQCVIKTSVPGRPADYRGKVRDIYFLQGERMAIVATDRISAFDHIFREPIPFKGQLLNKLACHGFGQIGGICTHHLLDVPHPNILLVRKCEPIPVEIVVRGYLTGHAWRVYNSGGRTLCGQPMPDGLQQHQAFPAPIITPTTKARQGHDEDITEQEILSRGLVTGKRWEEIRAAALALYDTGWKSAHGKGLILVDTKYEFGLYQDELVLIDEVHTADSSRFFYADGYEKRLRDGAPQKQLSKEFLREWLIENGHHAALDHTLPSLPDDLRMSIYHRYRELYEKLTGLEFKPEPTQNLNAVLTELLGKWGTAG